MSAMRIFWLLMNSDTIFYIMIKNFLKRIYKTRLEKEANEFAIRFLTYDVNMDNYENLEFLAKEKGIPLKIWYSLCEEI